MRDQRAAGSPGYCRGVDHHIAAVAFHFDFGSSGIRAKEVGVCLEGRLRGTQGVVALDRGQPSAGGGGSHWHLLAPWWGLDFDLFCTIIVQ